MIDINYIGHICYDEVLHPDGRSTRHVGGAAIYGSVASAVAGASVAAELMLAPADEAALEVIRARGIAVYPVYTPQTTSVQVRHRSADMDDRTIVTRSFAGLFEAPPLARYPGPALSSGRLQRSRVLPGLYPFPEKSGPDAFDRHAVLRPLQ